jgi:hypothetical protein
VLDKPLDPDSHHTYEFKKPFIVRHYINHQQPTGAPQYGAQAYPGASQPQGQGGYSQQQQYGQPPPQQYGYGQQQQYPPQGQYSAPHPGQYGGAAPVGGAPMLPPSAFRASLQATIDEKRIQAMFPNPQVLDQICQVAPSKVEQLCQTWRVPREVGQDIVKLALFDIIIYVGKSPKFPPSRRSTS